MNNLLIVCDQCHKDIHNSIEECIICGNPVKKYGLCEEHYIKRRMNGCPLFDDNNEDCVTCGKSEEERMKCLSLILESGSSQVVNAGD